MWGRVAGGERRERVWRETRRCEFSSISNRLNTISRLSLICRALMLPILEVP